MYTDIKVLRGTSCTNRYQLGVHVLTRYVILFCLVGDVTAHYNRADDLTQNKKIKELSLQ